MGNKEKLNGKVADPKTLAINVPVDELSTQGQIHYYKEKLRELEALAEKESKEDSKGPSITGDIAPVDASQADKITAKPAKAELNQTSTVPYSKRKRELAEAIEKAEEKVDEANKLYEIAQQQASEILKQANKEATDIVSKAKAKVQVAENLKLDALLNFTKEFGVYTTTYSGNKAIEEYRKATKRFDDAFKSFWTNFWF